MYLAPKVPRSEIMVDVGGKPGSRVPASASRALNGWRGQDTDRTRDASSHDPITHGSNTMWSTVL